jgi:hypothetical protein
MNISLEKIGDMWRVSSSWWNHFAAGQSRHVSVNDWFLSAREAVAYATYLALTDRY